MVMEPMQGKLASSQFDFGYTGLFCVPGVISVFFPSCDSVFWDSGVQSSKSRLLTCLIGKHNCSAHNAGESGLISWLGDSLMRFLELRQEPGVYSLVTAGMSIPNWSMFSKVRTPV